MNKDKNQQSKNEQQASQDQNTRQSRPESGQSQPVSNRSEGNAMNEKEKKPYSHRTGDATNFGERSYQED
jgi:hypothetical protein